MASEAFVLPAALSRGDVSASLVLVDGRVSVERACVSAVFCGCVCVQLWDATALLLQPNPHTHTRMMHFGRTHMRCSSC